MTFEADATSAIDALTKRAPGQTVEQYLEANPPAQPTPAAPAPVEPAAQPANVVNEPVVTPVVQPEAAPVVTPQAEPQNNGITVTPAAEPVVTEPAVDFKAERDRLQAEREQIQKERDDYKSRLDEIEPVIPHIKNPFADPIIHQLNHFVSKSGIKDIRFATEVLNTSPEQIKSDPLRAIALAEGLSNPDLAAMGVEKLMLNALYENGIDRDTPMAEWPEDIKLKMEVKAARALKTISDRKAEWGSPEDFYVTSQAKAKEQQEIQQAQVKEWQRIVPGVLSEVKELNYDVDVKGIKMNVKVALSQTDIEDAFRKVTHIIPTLTADDKGRSALKSHLEEALRSAKQVQVAQAIAEEYDRTHRANVEQEIHRAKYNGAPAVNIHSPETNTNKKLDEASEAISQLGKPKPRPLTH